MYSMEAGPANIPRHNDEEEDEDEEEEVERGGATERQKP